MRSLVFYILFFILFQLTAKGDNYIFKVFYMKGDVSLLQNSKSITPLKDQLIYPGDKITLEEKSTIVLLNIESKPLVIEKAGIYSTKNIEELFENIDHDNLSQKYFNYVVEEFMQHHGQKIYTGAVTRGPEIGMLSPLDSCIIMSNEIIFQWNNPELKNCWFFIYSLDGERLYESQSAESELIFDIAKRDLKKGSSYLWMVSLNQFPVKDDILNLITIASDKQIQVYESEMIGIKERFTDENYSWDMETNLLLLYGFFSKNKLFEEAQKVKKVIIDNYPNSELFND